MRIALISLEQQWLDKAGNFSRCREMANEAALELDICDIDAAETARYRRSFPTVRDKRYALYRQLFGTHAC